MVPAPKGSPSKDQNFRNKERAGRAGGLLAALSGSSVTMGLELMSIFCTWMSMFPMEPTLPQIPSPESVESLLKGCAQLLCQQSPTCRPSLLSVLSTHPHVPILRCPLTQQPSLSFHKIHLE